MTKLIEDINNSTKKALEATFIEGCRIGAIEEKKKAQKVMEEFGACIPIGEPYRNVYIGKWDEAIKNFQEYLK